MGTNHSIQSFFPQGDTGLKKLSASDHRASMHHSHLDREQQARQSHGMNLQCMSNQHTQKEILRLYLLSQVVDVYKNLSHSCMFSSVKNTAHAMKVKNLFLSLSNVLCACCRATRPTRQPTYFQGSCFVSPYTCTWNPYMYACITIQVYLLTVCTFGVEVIIFTYIHADARCQAQKVGNMCMYLHANWPAQAQKPRPRRWTHP